MYDHIVWYWLIRILDWEKPPPSKFRYNNLIFHPKWSGDFVKYYYAKDQFGLLHKIYPDKYQIENSLHKAYSILMGSYGNHSDFNFKQACHIIMHLSKLYNFQLNKSYVRKIETAVNIEVNGNPIDYIQKLRSVQFTKEPENMRNYNKVYGKRIVFSQFSFKLYDKTYQSYHEYRQRIDKNIVRFELAYNNITSIKEHAATLAHLTNLNNYVALTEILDRRFRSLTFNNSYNLNDLTPREVDTYYAGLSSDYWRYLQKRNKNTSTTKRRKYKEIMKKLEHKGSDELLLELRLKCRNKIYRLV